MIYKWLSIADGGGVDNPFCRGDRTSDAAVCIGLGGTGRDALVKLKQKVSQHLKPYSEDPLAPPSCTNIRYLLIDADAQMANQGPVTGRLDRLSEYFSISNGNIREAFASGILKRRKEMKWLNPDLQVYDAAYGGGGNRQLGRFLLMDKAGELRQKLTSVILEAASCSQSGQVDIYIFSGLSGGVGGGGFLDTCYIVRSVLEDVRGGRPSRIYGCFFLPDVNPSKWIFYESPLIAKHLRANGYASLKELDYLMNLQQNGGRFRQDYGDFLVDTVRPPVDQCFLVSGATPAPDGTRVRDDYDRALEAAAEHVFTRLMKSRLWMAAAPGNPQASMRYGAYSGYSILGAAAAEMPVQDIATYLGAKLFQRLTPMYDARPMEEDLRAFMAKGILSYENIQRHLMKGVVDSFPIREYTPKDLIYGIANPRADAEAWLRDAEDKMRQNMESAPLGSKEPLTDMESLVFQIYKELYAGYATNPGYGPVFAARMLDDRYPGLFAILYGCITENKGILAVEERLEKKLEDDAEAAEAQLRNTRLTVFNNGKKQADGYLVALSSLYSHRLCMVQCYCMKDVLNRLRVELERMKKGLFGGIADVLWNAKETFDDNAGVLSGRLDGTLKYELDRAVNSLDINQVIRDLSVRMFDQSLRWMPGNPMEISQMISKFIREQFPGIILMSMMQFHGIYPGNHIGAALYEMVERAKPRFWMSAGFPTGELGVESAFFVPSNAPVLANAAVIPGNPGGVSVSYTDVTDRIVLDHVWTGLPLYAYGGLRELEQAYEDDHSAGLHLYETEELNWRTFLPSPIPEELRGRR